MVSWLWEQHHIQHHCRRSSTARQVQARLGCVADALRSDKDAASSSSSSSEDECTDAEMQARLEAKLAKKEAKALEKAAKKAAKACEKEAKRAAKAARRAQEALAAVDGSPIPAAAPCEPLLAPAGELRTAPVAAQLIGERAAGAGGVCVSVADASPPSGTLVLRTLRGDLVLGSAEGPHPSSNPGPAPAPAAVVEVCQGKACMKRGAAAVLAGLEEALGGDAGVAVGACKCLDQCKKGPNLRVRAAGEQPVIAVGMPPEQAALAVLRTQ